MALLLADSWAAYSTTTHVQNRGWVIGAYVNATFSTSYNRISGVRGVRVTDGYGFRWSLGSNLATLGVGFAFKPQSSAQNTSLYANILVGFIDDTTTQLNVRYNYDENQLEVRRHTTVLGTAPLLMNVWHHLEVKATIHSSTGAVVVRVDGVEVLSLSGQNTQQTANSYANKLGFLGTPTGGSPSYNYTEACDLVVWDTSGIANNDFLGDVRVVYLAPNATGDSSNWTRSTGSSNYECVDEIPLNDTDYVESAAVNNRDLYNVTNLTATTGTVKAVQVLGRALKTDAGLRQFALLNKSGATETVGTTHTLASSEAFYSQLWETNPDTTAAWSLADVNSLQIGVKDIA